MYYLEPAKAAEPTSQTLICNGTEEYRIRAEDHPSEKKSSLGIVIDLAAQTIRFGQVWSDPIPITKLTGTALAFETEDLFAAAQKGRSPSSFMFGNIDRLSGETFAILSAMGSTTYLLHCKPAQRMF
jgi:hypothetical protein